ncbi:MAG: hypothetical protein FJ271_20980 [Planctomycetes bacterium]|nr:hypothetical protein [Planctomycetota bacterium]
MSLPLADALRLVDLEPGHIYRERVNGFTVEVRVLADSPATELSEHIMLQPWVDLPFDVLRTLPAHRGPAQLSKPMVLAESDLAPE